MKKPYEWHSDLAKLLTLYVEEKRMMGFRFNRPEQHLKQFDAYYDRLGYSGVRLTRQMVDGFIYTVPERPSSHYLKERIIRGFAQFLVRNGYREIYVPEITSAPRKRSSFVPYIFTEDEMKRIFTAIDSWEDSHYSQRSLIDPVFFRLLYGTGMRLTEVRSLLVKDFDANESLLTVHQGKNNKDRLIPLSPSLNSRIVELMGEIHRYSQETDYLFPSCRGNRIDSSTVYRHFREYLWRAGITHTNYGPRVHDLRHNFAVKCLKRWVFAGEELTSMLPYLAAYMGHSDFRGTQYYLRLTADLYPSIICRMEENFGYVIPKGGGDGERI